MSKEPATVSNSEIQVFKNCRRRWWLQYYREMSPRDVTGSFVGPLSLGTRIHAALEQKFVNHEDPVSVYKELFEEDKSRFEETDAAAFVNASERFYAEGDLGRIMVEGFESWLAGEGVDTNYSIIAAESQMEYPILGGKILVKGKTDLFIEDLRTGTLRIGDIKTAVQIKPYHDMINMSEQLMLYCCLARLTQELNVSGGSYLVLKKVKRSSKSKPPYYELIEVDYNQKTLDNFWNRIIAEASEILSVRDRLDAGESHQTACYPSPGPDCSWKCPFFSGCYMFDDGSDAERWLSDNFVRADQNARYQQDEPTT